MNNNFNNNSKPYKNVDLLGNLFVNVQYNTVLIPEDIIAGPNGEIQYICSRHIFSRPLVNVTNKNISFEGQSHFQDKNKQVVEEDIQNDSEGRNNKTLISFEDKNEAFVNANDDKDIQTIEDLKKLEDTNSVNDINNIDKITVFNDSDYSEEETELLNKYIKQHWLTLKELHIMNKQASVYVKAHEDSKGKSIINYYFLKKDSQDNLYYELWTKLKNSDKNQWYRCIFDVEDYNNVIKADWYKDDEKGHMKTYFKNFEYDFNKESQKNASKNKEYTLIRYIAITSGMMEKYNNLHPRKNNNMFGWRVVFKKVNYENARRSNIKFVTPEEAKQRANKMKKFKNHEHYDKAFEENVKINNNGGIKDEVKDSSESKSSSESKDEIEENNDW